MTFKEKLTEYLDNNIKEQFILKKVDRSMSTIQLRITATFADILTDLDIPPTKQNISKLAQSYIDIISGVWTPPTGFRSKAAQKATKLYNEKVQTAIRHLEGN